MEYTKNFLKEKKEGNPAEKGVKMNSHFIER